MYLKVGNYEIVFFNADEQTVFTESDTLGSLSVTFTPLIIPTIKKINNVCDFRFTAKTGSRSILGQMEIPLIFKTAEEYHATKKARVSLLVEILLIGSRVRFNF